MCQKFLEIKLLGESVNTKKMSYSSPSKNIEPICTSPAKHKVHVSV